MKLLHLVALVVVAGLMLARPVAAAAETPKSPAAARKPNVLFILVDDLGWNDLHCYGSDFYLTPNIDKIAAGGMRFTDAYAACCVCSPSRAAIMTGKFPARLHLTDYLGAARSPADKSKWRRNSPLEPADYVRELPLKEVTIAESLKQAGYTTFFAGKWHLGPKGYWPTDQGFDYNYGGCDWGHAMHGYFSPWGNPTLKDGPKGEFLTNRMGQVTSDFIKSHKDKSKPWFVELAFYAVHEPIQAPAQLIEQFKKRKEELHLTDVIKRLDGRPWRQTQADAAYAALVNIMDQNVGRVLDAVHDAGLDDNTIIIFTSDNGGLATVHGNPPTSLLPLRAGKGWAYEGGTRIPLIIKWPGVAKGGSVCSAPVMHTDYYPTILDMLGLPQRPKQTLDGRSIVPLLKGQSLPTQVLFWHYPHYSPQGGTPSSTIRNGDWKLIDWFGRKSDTVKLFNLHNDIGESHDLAARYPQRVDEMLQQLKGWRTSVNAAPPFVNPNYHPDARSIEIYETH